jgi:esterase/lipase
MLVWARTRNHVLPTAVGLAGLLTTLWFWHIHVVAGVLAMSVSGFVLYLEIVTQLSFRAPPRRKPVLDKPGWEVHRLSVDGCTVQHYVWMGEPSNPVALLVHGWTSGAVRMDGRAASFVERGWSVVLVDLPGHGASDSLTKWSAEQCTTILLGGLDQLSERLPIRFDHGVWFYGHSIGAFIGLRISKRRGESRWGQHLQGWVFESPMTGYTEIHNETCNMLRIPNALRSVVLSKTLRHFNALNAKVGTISGLSEAEMPRWGVPHEPVLLVQADPDERLGPSHHKRLVSSMNNHDDTNLLTVHMLPDLRHTGGYLNAPRKEKIDAWLDEQKVHSSSI